MGLIPEDPCCRKRNPVQMFIAAQAGMLAPEGRCKTLNASADGYVRSEACAALLLRMLGDCDGTKEGLAVLLRGCAVNQDGRSSSLTAPSGAAQQV